MRKSPKSFYCILWALVGIRLICPFSFESRFSVVPKEEVIPINTILTIPDTRNELDFTNTGNFATNEVLFESDNSIVTNKTVNIADIVSIVWITGTIGILLYGIISYIRLKRIVSVSIKEKENVFLCDSIDVPFIFGIFKPKIYLPSNIEDNQKEFVLLHEKAHLSRHDNLWKPIGFILLAIYWFNPLVWIAYHLFSKDIELATDEKVINNLNNDEIKDYSKTLLSFSMIKSNLMIKTCPVAFGEVGVKDRIKAVLSYKKPSFWIILLAIISCIAVSVCFFTKQKEEEDYLYDIAIDYLKEKYTKEDNEHYSDKDDYQIFFDYEGFGTSAEGNNKYAYMWVSEESYYAEDGEVKIGSGSSMAYKVTFSGDKVISVENPKDGTYYVPSINEMFPKGIAKKILNYNFDNSKLEKMVEEHYSYLNNSLSSQSEKKEYQNIMGYDTYYIDTENAPNFYTRDYYTKYDGKDYLIAESYGFEKERGDVIKDINGDGYSELICNCVSGGDGHPEAYIFMRDLSSSSNGPSVMRCNIDYEKLSLDGFFNWGINSFSTKYEPNNNRFAITYSKGNENKSEDVTIYINDNEIMEKLTFRKHISENNNALTFTSAYGFQIEISNVIEKTVEKYGYNDGSFDTEYPVYVCMPNSTVKIINAGTGAIFEKNSHPHFGIVKGTGGEITTRISDTMNGEVIDTNKIDYICDIESGIAVAGFKIVSNEDVNKYKGGQDITDWSVVTIDSKSFNIDAKLENSNFEYIFSHLSTVPLDQLIAFHLATDGAYSEGSIDELRLRFIGAPNVFLTYLELMGKQTVNNDSIIASEIICKGIASIDVAWYDCSDEFKITLENCKQTYTNGRIAELLKIIEDEYEASKKRYNK